MELTNHSARIRHDSTYIRPRKGAGWVVKMLIRGGRRLEGRVRVSGRKNAAVAVIPAALLGNGISHLDNIPSISDVHHYIDIINALGAQADWVDANRLRIDARGLDSVEAPYEMAKRMRASYYLLGVLLARFGQAEVAMPGGCDIGMRPIDQHLKGFRALGADVSIDRGIVRCHANRLVGASIYLDVVSVGATMNIMLAATTATGTTVIENAAKEPHVVDLANCLNAMGARVVGAGTDVIKIHGVKSLGGADHAIIPDEVEAATFMVAVAATRGHAVIENVIPRHLEPVTAKLREAGIEVMENGESLQVRAKERPRAVNIKTLAYPGFPTDVQQPMTVLLSLAKGTSVVTETIWEGRFRHVDELQRMGTRIRVDGRTAVIEGVPELTGAIVQASDLRAGAALVVAGLAAQEETEVRGLEHVERGYEHLEAKLEGLGAEVERVVEDEPYPSHLLV